MAWSISGERSMYRAASRWRGWWQRGRRGIGSVATLNTLSAFRHQTKFRGHDGNNGAKQNMTGRSGEDLIIPVPPGTIVIDDDTGETIGDLVDPGTRLVIAQGGRGGRGNARFASSIIQVPRIAEKGAPAQERNLRLELKLIADVGIVGVPNPVSPLFWRRNQCQTKIAAYPFTTLEPNLGVAHWTMIIHRPGGHPGLIEGAHQGIGLGHVFLRHISVRAF